MIRADASATLSLLIAYRHRRAHLEHLLGWLAAAGLGPAVRPIVIEAAATPTVESLVGTLPGAEYQFLDCPGTFHKTRALNLGLSLAISRFVVPYDVDLIPHAGSLERHLALAAAAPQLLVTGYRLMLADGAFEARADVDPRIAASVAPEDRPGALKIQLVNQERFGVCPLFERRTLVRLGGWEESFVGWGSEDQDLLDRYLAAGRALVRSPEILYLHLHHPPDPDWSEDECVARNQAAYDARAAARR